MNNFWTWGNDSGNNRPFHGFLKTFDMGKSVLILVKLPNLKVNNFWTWGNDSGNNRPFHGFLKTFDMDKSALILVKLPNLKVKSLKRVKIWKFVGWSARDKPERYCGWFWVHWFSKKFERMAREAMDICLQVLKESNKRRLESYTARNRVLIISHITFRDCRVHIFNDNRPRNSCISNG